MSNEGYPWSINDARVNLLHAESNIKRKVRSVWSGFIEFALRENVLAVAVGLIIASALTAVVNSLVSDILLPPFSLLPFISKNMEEKFWILREGPHYSGSNGYNTRKQAIDDGAVVMTYGTFLDKVLSFIGMGLTLYIIAGVYGVFSHDSIIKHYTKCPYCRKEISQKAKRCPLCTSWLDGREDTATSALYREQEGSSLVS